MYISGDDSKLCRFLQEKILKFQQKSEYVVGWRKVEVIGYNIDSNDRKNLVEYLHIKAPFMNTNGDATRCAEKKNTYYTVTIENSGEYTIEKCTYEPTS